MTVINVTGLALPDDAQLERALPSKIAARASGRLNRFDYKTLFYDAVNDGKRTHLIGPPLLNLTPTIEGASFAVGGEAIETRPVLRDTRLTQKSHLQLPADTKRLQIVNNELGWSATLAISKQDRNTFRGRRVLVSMSKNNPLEWIRDWVEFNVKVHGVDGVLLYDNASTEYSPEDVESVIKSVRSDLAVVIVTWPFRYGPHLEQPGIGPSAQYSQTSMFRHARIRFLKRASFMLSTDIDELIVPKDDRTVFDHAAASPRGMVIVGGHWVEEVRTANGLPRFWHFDMIWPGRRPPSTKWAVDLARLPRGTQLNVHKVWFDRSTEAPDPSLTLYHFRGLNTRWKDFRKEFDRQPEASELSRDNTLRAVLDRVFSADADRGAISRS